MLRRIVIAGLAAFILFYTIIFIQFGTIWFFDLRAMKELVFIFLFLLVTLWTHEKLAAFFNSERFSGTSPRIIALLEAGTVILISIIYSVLFTFVPQYLFIETVDFQPVGVRLNLMIAAIISLFIYYFVERERGKDKLQREFLRAEQLQKENFRAQLETVRSQVDPHFLFNSLNVLSSLVHRNPDKAVEFIGQLSRVYRIILDSGPKSVITVNSEMELVRAYAYLMTTRFGNNIRFSIDLPDIEKHYIPPASVQLLVENAIKHNSFSKNEPLGINIFIREDYLVVENNIQPKQETETSSKVGLKNIISRYKHITDKEVKINSEGNNFIVSLPLIKAEEL